MSIKLGAGMPKGEYNGLAGQEAKISSSPDNLVPIVVLCEVEELGQKVATDEPTVKLRIAEIEMVDSDSARALIRQGRKQRTGHEELDLEGLGDDD